MKPIKREIFFLPVEYGHVLLIYTHPVKVFSKQRDIIYIHPLADEMNKSRRMAALQTHAFSRAGFGVLQIDLYGCGDSSGDFFQARWHLWKENITSSVNWLLEKRKSYVSLWGLRLGSLLIADWAKSSDLPIEAFIFWQPILNGRIAMNQLLRLAAASSMLGKNGKSSKEIRDILSQGKTVEIGGYEFHPDLVAAIEEQSLEDWRPPKEAWAIWNEVSINDPPEITFSGKKIIDMFQSDGCRVKASSVSGHPFWNSIEIVTVQELITSTTNAVTGTLL